MENRQKIRKEIIEISNGMRFHRGNFTRMIQKICSQYRQDYCKIQSDSHLHNPQNDYLRQRQKREKAVADEHAAIEKAKELEKAERLEKELEIKNLEKPKESAQPAKPMSAASQAMLATPYAMSAAPCHVSHTTQVGGCIYFLWNDIVAKSVLVTDMGKLKRMSRFSH